MKRYSHLFLLPLLGTLLLMGNASARTVEPGSFWASGALGPGFKAGSLVGGSDAFLMLNLQAEYCVSTEWSSVTDVDWGIAGTIPLRLRTGARYRLTGMELPISPYAQAQVSGGRLFDAIGANLWLVGARGALGADYFLTAKLAAGAMFSVDLSTTLGERPALYTTTELLITASYAF